MTGSSQPQGLPDDLRQLMILAEAHDKARRFPEVEAICRKILETRPDFAEIHGHLGNALLNQGKSNEARPVYERALSLDPGLFRAHVSLGNILREQGKFSEALARYDRALEIQADFAEAHFNRAEVKTFRTGDPDLAALQSLVADANHLPPSSMRYLHFALGKALEDVGDYRRAFEHLLQGNALQRREVIYDEAAQQRSFQCTVDVFDSHLLDRFQGLGDPSAAPIFVLGMPRSGSTLIEQILAGHPQVHAAGELPNLAHIVRSLTDAAGRPTPYPQCIPALDADGLRRLGQAYLASLPTLSDGKTRVSDKMPSNFLHVGLIRLILPNARIIHTLRDPVDTCVSCFSKLFVTGQTYTYDLAELGCYYRWYSELMDHWRSVLPAGAMLDVSYEDVVDNLEAQARRLIDYCGLPWDDRCLRFHKSNRPIATASNVQVRQPLYRSSLQRWRRYEAYLEPLLAELAAIRSDQSPPA